MRVNIISDDRPISPFLVNDSNYNMTLRAFMNLCCGIMITINLVIRETSPRSRARGILSSFFKNFFFVENFKSAFGIVMNKTRNNNNVTFSISTRFFTRRRRRRFYLEMAFKKHRGQRGGKI